MTTRAAGGEALICASNRKSRNLLNDNWCVLKEAGFPRTDDVVDMTIENGQYLYQSFVNPGGQSRATDASLWEMRVGLKYSF